MIPAAEALRLPCAHLTKEEQAAADALDGAIDAHLRAHMTRGGVTFDALEIRAPVVADVQIRLRAAGYQVQAYPLEESSRLCQGGQGRLVGYRLAIVPAEEAYRIAAQGYRF